MAIITIPNIIKTNSFGTGKVTNIGIIKDTDAVQHASPSTTKSKDEPNTSSANKAPFQNKKAAGTVLQWCESASPSANYINLNCCMSWMKSHTFSSRDTYPLWRNCWCLEKPVCYYLLLPQLLVAGRSTRLLVHYLSNCLLGTKITKHKGYELPGVLMYLGSCSKWFGAKHHG